MQQEGLPLWGDVGDGNQSDKIWNQGAMDGVASLLSPEARREVIYVADSACVTKTNLDRLAGQKLRFISRLPASFGLTPELIEQAWSQGDWTEVGALAERGDAATYRVQSFVRPLYEKPYRFVVVHSSHTDKRKQQKIERELAEEKTALAEAADELKRQLFVCLANAEPVFYSGRMRIPYKAPMAGPFGCDMVPYTTGDLVSQMVQLCRVLYWLSTLARGDSYMDKSRLFDTRSTQYAVSS